jgi:hypothetical protein
MTTCVFTMCNNQLTTVSGADEGTYLLKDNSADILISGVTSNVRPFDLAISKINNETYTIEV